MTTLQQGCRKDLGESIACLEGLLHNTEDGHDIADVAVIQETRLARESGLEMLGQGGREIKQTTEILVEFLAEGFDLAQTLAVEG